MVFSFHRSHALIICFALFCASCSKEDDGPGKGGIPPTCLTEDNEIIISNIKGIPAGVVFDRVKVDITGVAWDVIGSVEAPYKEGKAVLELPTGFADEDLCKVYSDDALDNYGYWPAEEVDNRDAKVAGFSGDNNIIAYNGDKAVGRLFLTDSEGENANDFQNYILYHYTNQPFTLSGYNLTIRGNQKSFRYEASFKTGWNAYLKVRGDINLITTTIPEEISLSWRFERWTF